MTDTNAAAAEALARGRALRSARIGRARTIRRRVIAGAVALFVAAWLLISVVLVSGHDPALASKSSAATVASTPSSSGTTATTGSSGSTGSSVSGSATSGSSGTSSQSNSSASSGSGVSSVVTSQS